MIYHSPIDGVLLEDVKIIPTSGGAVLRMLRPDTELLKNHGGTLGELYFSEIENGVVRAWKLHSRQEQLFSIPCGLAQIGFSDLREDSPTYGVSFSMILGRPDHYRLLRVPTNVWYGFMGLSEIPALICNYASLPHDPEEMRRAPESGPGSPASWPSLAAWSLD